MGCERGFLVQKCDDRPDAAHVCLVSDREDGTCDRSLAQGDANTMPGLEGVAPEVGDAIVEGVARGVIELNFCEETARPFEFERGFGVRFAGFPAGHGG